MKNSSIWITRSSILSQSTILGKVPLIPNTNQLNIIHSYIHMATCRMSIIQKTFFETLKAYVGRPKENLILFLN